MAREVMRFPCYRDTCERCGRVETWVDEWDKHNQSVLYASVDLPPVREEGKWPKYPHSAGSRFICEFCIDALQSWWNDEKGTDDDQDT